MPYDKRILLFVLSFFLFCSAEKSFALPLLEDSTQSFTADSAERTLIVSLNYGTDRVNNGRLLKSKDSTEMIRYATPDIYYEANSGFYSSLSLFRTLKPVQSWDETDFSLGWEFILFKRVNASAGYTHYFFAKNSQQATSERNSLDIFFYRNSKIITPELYFNFYFGQKQTDVRLILDLEHEFDIDQIFLDNDYIIIKPTATLIANSLNFYTLYLKNIEKKLTAKNVGVRTDSKFNITGVEFSLPVPYGIGRFNLTPAFHYNIPLNQPAYLSSKPITYFTLSLGFVII